MSYEYELRLRKLRKAAGLTQGELARRVGVTDRILGSWEREESALSLRDAYACALALGCTVDDLCGWEGGRPPGEAARASPPPDPAREALREAWDAAGERGRAALSAVAGLAALAPGR